MTLYDLTKKYGTGKGESTMWKTISVISDAVEIAMPEEEINYLMRRVYGTISDEHYNEEFARDDIERMYYIDQDGEKHYAPYWSYDALQNIYRQHKNEIPNYNCWDWAVTMNMIKSDYCPLIMEWFPDIDDNERNEKIVELSLNWLKDADNPFGNSKIWGYLNSR